MGEACSERTPHASSFSAARSKDGAGAETPADTLNENAGRRERGEKMQTSPSPAEEQPRPAFHIPRKNKESKDFLQHLSLDSREFDDIMKIINCSYLQSSSAENFVYPKACLVHNEYLEKEFVEKRKELKQNGRTENELAESYGFLLTEPYKLQELCEKGLKVGHSKITILGNPGHGVYLSRYADLLQCNPFDAGTKGEIVIFKILKGKVKSIIQTKTIFDPTPNFDSHVSKNAYKVKTSRSYRAFELTQQYFYEYNFDETRTRPRHVCPYAVITFLYQEKVALPPQMPSTVLRSDSIAWERRKGRNSYTVWSGQLVNQGKVVCHASIHSSTHLFLPVTLPENLEIGRVMKLEDVMQKIPPVWEMCKDAGEKSMGWLHCSLFEVHDKSKEGNGLCDLLKQLELKRMVLVHPLIDKGFLFLLSSAQMGGSRDAQVGWTWGLRALFLFQETRKVNIKSSQWKFIEHNIRHPIKKLQDFVPALHYALFKLQKLRLTNPAEVERQARIYLRNYSEGKISCFNRGKYMHFLDAKEKLFPAPRKKPNIDASMSLYLYHPHLYQLTLEVAEEMMQVQNHSTIKSPEPEGEDQNEKSTIKCDPGKVEKLKHLIQKHKDLVRLSANSNVLKRKAEKEAFETGRKHPRLDCRKNEEAELPSCLSDVMDYIETGDTDLRDQQSKPDSVPNSEMVLKLLLKALQQAIKQGSSEFQSDALAATSDNGEELPDETVYEALRELGLPVHCDIDLRKQLVSDHLEEGDPDSEDMEENFGSLSSLDEFSPRSIGETSNGLSCSEETPIVWRLIPLTGIKTPKYSPMKNDGSIDPRLQISKRDDPSPRAENETKREYVLHDNQATQQRHSDGHLKKKKDLKSICNQPNSKTVPEELSTCINATDNKKPKGIKIFEKNPRSQNSVRCKGSIGVNATHDKDASRIIMSNKTPQDMNDANEIGPKAPDVSKENYSDCITNILTQPSKYVNINITKEPNTTKNSLDRKPKSMNATLNMLPKNINADIGRDPRSTKTILDKKLQGQDTNQNTEPNSANIGSTQDKQLLDEDCKDASGCQSFNCTFDSIINEEFHNFSKQISEVLNCEQVMYNPRLVRFHQQNLQPPILAFSEYVTHYIKSPPVQSDVDIILEQIKCIMDSSAFTLAKTFSAPHTVSDDCIGDSSSSGTLYSPQCNNQPSGSAVQVDMVMVPSEESNGYTDLHEKSLQQTNCLIMQDLDSTKDSASITDVIGQIMPEMFSSLVEIIKDIQKNTVKFYIHAMEENVVCAEIKDHLIHLGNVACNPETFQGTNDSLEKLLIIIQNKDIMDHLHTIPNLVSLKKLSGVVFSGVNSLDDLKNHSYRSIFENGGLIVSDDFVLNPDFITHNTLQLFLKFIEEKMGSFWRWSVHYKTLHKLEQLSHVNNEALALLDLLNIYRKKQVVEFLPYHNCDNLNQHAPDLNCLIKLQAEHTHFRHVIFLTERRVEMFPHHCNNGILIASIDDIMNALSSLIGSTERWCHPRPTEKLSEKERPNDSEEPPTSVQRTLLQRAEQEQEYLLPQSLLQTVEMETFQTTRPAELDLNLASDESPEKLLALKAAISMIKADRSKQEHVVGGEFHISPHQSFLCSSRPQTPSAPRPLSPLIKTSQPVSPCHSMLPIGVRNNDEEAIKNRFQSLGNHCEREAPIYRDVPSAHHGNTGVLPGVGHVAVFDWCNGSGLGLGSYPCYQNPSWPRFLQ